MSRKPDKMQLGWPGVLLINSRMEIERYLIFIYYILLSLDYELPFSLHHFVT